MNNTKLPKRVISEPYYKITTAKELLCFTLRICDMLKKREIDEDKLNKTILVDNILRIECHWESQMFTALATDLRLTVLGNCFIIIDEALDGIFGDKPKQYSDTDIDALRAIIYMLRCAVAHSPTAPVWEVKGSKHRRNFRINEIGYELKVKDLDGKGLLHKDYGGIAGVLSLINYSLEIVKKYAKRDGED